ncbi:MAG: phosphoribosylformylglycinamidine synthase [Bacillota bacterium]|nr:phosphoribosylformylglycinamidine synthase [Bacillota bacterium]
MVYRIYSEKKAGYNVEAQAICKDLNQNLQIASVISVRIFNRYDVEGISAEVFELAKNSVFSEPPVDDTYAELPEIIGSHRIFASEYLPGQFDQRAASAAECIELITCEERPIVRTARIYVLKGEISDSDFIAIKDYLINKVESREASLSTYETLKQKLDIPSEVETLTGFNSLNETKIEEFLSSHGLAMDKQDLLFCQKYFRDTEHRDPTITEIRVLDTYWSDHCRHTTFLTEIENIDIKAQYIKKAFEKYENIRKTLYVSRKKPMTLMDIATIGAKELKRQGILKNLDESDEINACSVKVKVNIDGKPQDYVLMFKNETHNHPTEIEPFGGAATCLGGAIRDPLSGRSYVYHAMRITGAGDPREAVSETLPGKLPQKKLTTTAAAGFSSYGNQIGLATGYVNEVYHDGYIAKRLETGAVIGAAPIDNIRREEPVKGDIIILLGGRTGRDGCGGATGSSKSHTAESLATCGAEVQKGNPPVERKIQRLFRKKEVTSLIKRCNDFGAGGVSVAIGELADGLIIDLSKVPKKYDGLDGTELAISESQERMAVVVSSEDADRFIDLANFENLEATKVAEVTDDERLTMLWNGKEIVSISREFINTNGAPKYTDVVIDNPKIDKLFEEKSNGSIKDKWISTLTDLNVCSQKGLVERFDSTIGAGSVTLPYGGKYQLTPSPFMAAKFPALKGESTTASVMAYGFNPNVSSQSPYHGALYAVVESVSRLVAAGCSYEQAYLTLQEFFPRTNGVPSRWGLPFAALLGALTAQLELGTGAIGGKDSMSGTFEHIDVPPTLISFAVSTLEADKIITAEFKKAGSSVYLISPSYDQDKLIDFESLKTNFKYINKLAGSGDISAAYALSTGGIAEAVSKMAFGNKFGFVFDKGFDTSLLFKQNYGAILVESDKEINGVKVGTVTETGHIAVENEDIDLEEILSKYENVFEKVFPTRAKQDLNSAKDYTFTGRSTAVPSNKVAEPRVVIPVFPGTNCEYDSAKAFERAGGKADIFVINTLSPERLAESIKELEKLIRQSQIVMLPGGFSGGDEPEGSAKFIAAIFRNERIRDAVTELLEQRDGLMLGICNGFQALIKLGLVPFGRITELKSDSPTLTFNNIGRHQSMMVNTKVSSVKSPWLSLCNAGDIHTIAISHGEGRFVAPAETIRKLAENGQIATQYVGLDGKPTMDMPFNPNGSIDAIEGITSPDGRVFGKMAHSERVGSYVAKNIIGNKDQKIFEAGIQYFK